MKEPAAIRELQVFCDLPAEAAIREAAAFFMERGLTITRQDTHSLGLLGPTAAAPSADRQAGPQSGQQPRWRPANWAPLMQREDASTVRDAGAVAAVTAQVDPGKCRVWLTVEGQGTVAARPRGGTGRALATTQRRRGGRGHCQGARRVHRTRLGRARGRRARQLAQDRNTARRGRAAPREAPATLGAHRQQDGTGRGVSGPTPAPAAPGVPATSGSGCGLLKLAVTRRSHHRSARPPLGERSSLPTA